MYLDYNINQIHNLFNKSKKNEYLFSTPIEESKIVFIGLNCDSFKDQTSSKIFFIMSNLFVKKKSQINTQILKGYFFL